MIHLVLQWESSIKLALQCFQIADCLTFLSYKVGHTGYSYKRCFYERPLSTPPPPKKNKKCNELFSKADDFRSTHFMKSKSPHSIMNSFWFIHRLSKVTNSYFTEKKIITSLQEICMRSLRNKKLRKPKSQSEVTGHFLSTWRAYFHTGRLQFRIGFNFCK